MSKKVPKPLSKMAFMGSGVADSDFAYSPKSVDVGPYSSKKSKHKEAHSSQMMSGMGDYYGTGQKNKMGRMRSSDYPGYMPVNKKQQGTPPTSVV